MESALYGIYAPVVFVSEISLVRGAQSFDFWYVNNSRVNTVPYLRQPEALTGLNIYIFLPVSTI